MVKTIGAEPSSPQWEENEVAAAPDPKNLAAAPGMSAPSQQTFSFVVLVPPTTSYEMLVRGLGVCCNYYFSM